MTKDEAAEMIKDDMRLHHDYLSGTYRKALNMAVDALKTEAEPVRHGYWTRIVKQGYAQDWFCSVCGETGRGDYAWCPRCGARMDKETEE